MNTSKPNKHLLETIISARTSVGEGLNEDELTRLLRQTALLAEAGFAFVSFSGGVVTLSVPQQDLANWYPEKGWIVPEKERVARAVAEKYDLLVGEPPDETSGFLFPGSGARNVHHHLELRNRWETVIVAHPTYLKVRVFSATRENRATGDAKKPLLLGPDLLHDLSALYEA